MKKSCSRCKKEIIGIPNKLGGALLCNECYPFERVNGKMEFKQGREGSLTFGKYGFKNGIKNV